MAHNIFHHKGNDCGQQVEDEVQTAAVTYNMQMSSVRVTHFFLKFWVRKLHN